jgi:hypothetical protein
LAVGGLRLEAKEKLKAEPSAVGGLRLEAKKSSRIKAENSKLESAKQISLIG